MTYAQDRIPFNADSHIMELPDFLIDHMDEAYKAVTPKVPAPTRGSLANPKAVASPWPGSGRP
jgi:hypothetical protein